MKAKKQKTPLVVAPFTPLKLTKIGERHGKFISDEFKPPNQTPKPKQKTPKVIVLDANKKYEEKSSKKRKPRQKRKPRVPSSKTVAKRTEYSEKIKNELRENATKAELLFKGKLEELEIEHEFQKEVITSKSFIVADFYIPALRLMVELDGGYHLSKEQKDKDRDKDREYKTKGYKVLRMPNEKVKSFDFIELKISVADKKPTKYIRKFIY